MRFLTINLLHGGFVPGLREETAQTTARLQLLGDEMVRLRPDVVTVQEALVASRHGSVATWLATRLGFEVRFAKANPFIVPPPLSEHLAGALRDRIDRVIAGALDFEEGVATLTALPIVSHAVHALPRPSFPLENRVALRVRVNARSGPLDVWNAHLTRAGGGHRRQARGLVELVTRESAGVRAVVLGDFNVSEETEGIQTLRTAGFVDVFRLLHPTASGLTAWQQVDAPSPTVSRRVDYCWLAPGTSLSPLDSTVVLDHPRPGPDGRPLWPSDHYGLLTEIAA